MSASIKREGAFAAMERELEGKRLEWHTSRFMAALLGRGMHDSMDFAELAKFARGAAEALVAEMDGLAEPAEEPAASRCALCRGPVERMGDGRSWCVNASCGNCHQSRRRNGRRGP